MILREGRREGSRIKTIGLKKPISANSGNLMPTYFALNCFGETLPPLRGKGGTANVLQPHLEHFI